MLIWQKIHGHLALLAVALAFHPPLAMGRARRPSRRTRLAGYLATMSCLAVSALGWAIYPAYRQEIRRQLYLTSVRLGQLFEIKEHLAWYALALSLAGGALMWTSARAPEAALAPAIKRTYLLSAILATVSAALGVYLATLKGFAYTL